MTLCRIEDLAQLTQEPREQRELLVGVAVGDTAHSLQAQTEVAEERPTGFVGEHDDASPSVVRVRAPPSEATVTTAGPAETTVDEPIDGPVAAP